MNDLVKYLAPRTLVLASIALALKFTVCPTMSLPISVANYFEPVWHVAATVKQSVTEITTRRASPLAVETVSSRTVAGSETSEKVTIEICPAGSKPNKSVVAANSATGTQAASKSSRVATSKQP